MTQQLFDGDTFEHRGRMFRVRFPRDESMGAPWEEQDGNGVVSDWTTRDKAPGEKVLVTVHKYRRYYDVQASIEIAKRDGWGPKRCAVCGEEAGGLGTSMYGSVHKYGPLLEHDFTPETREEQAIRAVEEDYEYLRGWCADEWEYVGVVVCLCDDDGNPDGGPDTQASLWGIESNSGGYLNTVARELADEIMALVEVDNPDVQLSEN